MLVNCDPRSDLIEFVAHLNQYYFIIPVHNVCGLPIDTISNCCGHLLVPPFSSTDQPPPGFQSTAEHGHLTSNGQFNLYAFMQ